MKRIVLVILTAATVLLGVQAQSQSDLARQIDALSKAVLESYQSLPQARSRTRIAVLDFEESSEFSRQNRLGYAFSEMVSTYLIENGKPLRVVERKQLDSILTELELRLSGLLEGEEAADMGQLIGVDLLLLGSIVEVGDHFSVSVRLVETDTGQAILGKTIEVSRAELIPEARKYIRIDNRLSLGYRLNYSDAFLEHEAVISYQYNFLKGLGLGFELSGAISSAQDLRINEVDSAGSLSYDLVTKEYRLLGLGIMFEAGALKTGPVEWYLEAGPRVLAYFDMTTWTSVILGGSEQLDDQPSVASNQIALGGAASLRAELPLNLNWRLGMAIHGRLFAQTNLAKTVDYVNIPDAFSGTVLFNDRVRLSGFGAWLGVAYRF
jgi:TolB-like protein